MVDFIHVESNRLKLSRNFRGYRLNFHSYGWKKQENIHRLIILIKILYIIIFLCFTIYTCLNQSIYNNINCSKNNFIQIIDIWYSFLGLILILSLFIDHFKQEYIISLKLINIIQAFLIIIFIIFVILGHIQGYYRLWFISSSSPIELSIISIILIDICPISIAVIIIINSLKKHRSYRRIHIKNLISNV